MIQKKKGKLENEVQNEVFKYLIDEGIFFWRSNNIPVFAKNNAGKYMYRSLPKHTPKGLPDIIALYKSRFIAIEVKRENACISKLSDAQEIFADRVINNGGIYIVARKVSDVTEIIKHIDSCGII